MGFNEGAESEPFFPEGGCEPRGVHVTAIGRAARQFSLADGALGPLRIWASGVSAGTVVLVAVVGIEADQLPDVLAAMESLGVPQGPVDRGCCAFAAAGVAVEEGSSVRH